MCGALDRHHRVVNDRVADRLVESVSDLDCEVAEDGSRQGIGEKKKMKS